MLFKYFVDRLPCIIEYASKQNVMVIKLLQTLAGIKNMPTEINSMIQQNTDRVYYSDDEIDYKLLLHITSKYKITLDSIEPINSGMIAVVFSGRNEKKERVVVKIRRNNIRSRIESGYQSLARIYKCICIIAYPFRVLDEALMNIQSFIDSKDYILTQCEFVNEIKAMNATRKTVEEYCTDIVVPYCYNDENDNDFIIMGFIEGTTCFNIDEKYKEKACRILCIFMFISSYFCEMGHADLHPGNIIIIPDGDNVKVGVIDFGMNMIWTKIARDFAHGCMEFIIETEKDPTKIVDVLKYCIGAITPPLKIDELTEEQYQAINKQVGIIIKSAGDGDIDEARIHSCVRELRKSLGCDTITLSMDIVKYAMSMSMGQSTRRLLVNDDKAFGVIVKSALKEVMSY